MAAWPILSRVACEPYSEKLSNNRDLLSNTEGGYVITRRRYSRARKTFSFSLPGLNASDYTTLTTFISNQGTTGNFTWTNPTNNVNYTVRFASIPKIVFDNSNYSASIELVEV